MHFPDTLLFCLLGKAINRFLRQKYVLTELIEIISTVPFTLQQL